MPTELNLDSYSSLALTPLLINLGIGVLLSLVLRWHFIRFGSTLSNREEFAQVFPFILLTTVLIISIVKSSLALSLGLVGALSIVRFRTPIKEPEELAYLFIAIALGLGLGANQTLPTVVAGLGILFLMAILNRFRGGLSRKNIYVSMDWNLEGEDSPEEFLELLTEVMSEYVSESDLRRYDVRDGLIEVTFLIDISDISELSRLSDVLRKRFPRLGITFLDQSRMPSL